MAQNSFLILKHPFSDSEKMLALGVYLEDKLGQKPIEVQPKSDIYRFTLNVHRDSMSQKRTP
jgi:hypothetical protein